MSVALSITTEEEYCMKRFIILAAAMLAFPAFADNQEKTNAPVAAAAVQLTDAEVRKVDKEAGKVTLKHGEIKNLDMPAMTMVFRVKESAMLDQLKPGDRIRFQAEKIGGQIVVTAMEPAR
jgi:Cu/Ag efflux protein CusF